MLTREQFREITEYADHCLAGMAHDREHVNRVVGYALRIAQGMENIDYDLLCTAGLLHDIGRSREAADPTLDHAVIGGDMAYDWLISKGYEPEFAEKVRKAIYSHRFRAGQPAESIEAQILFDADKLDACGMMGLFRTVSYNTEHAFPYYTVAEDGYIDVSPDAPKSVINEYIVKLAKLGERFYTQKARVLAADMNFRLRRVVMSTVDEVNCVRRWLEVKVPDVLGWNTEKEEEEP